MVVFEQLCSLIIQLNKQSNQTTGVGRFSTLQQYSDAAGWLWFILICHFDSYNNLIHIKTKREGILGQILLKKEEHSEQSSQIKMFCLRRNINKYNQNKRCSLDQLEKQKPKNSIKYNRLVFDTPSENPKNSLPFNITSHVQHQVTPKKQTTSPFFSNVIAKPQKQPSGNYSREKAALPSCLEKTRVNSLILDNRKNNKKEWNSVFKPYNNKNNRFDLKAFKRYFDQENANKFETTPGSVENSQQNNQSLLKDKDLRRTNSILIMKKIQRRREKIVQEQKQKYQEQFRTKKQVPIHHSQYNSIINKNVKAQQVNNRRLRKADRLMTQFIKLRQTMNEQMWFIEKTQEPQMIKFIQGQHIQHRPTKKMNKFNSKSFTIAKRGNKHYKAQKTKQEEQQFGPWNRTFTGDFDHLF